MPSPDPINMGEIDSLAKSMEDQMRLEMERKTKEYFDRIAASWPSELKPGMTFNRKTGDVLELVAPPRPTRARPAMRASSSKSSMSRDGSSARATKPR
jgi:hypothetical protein